MLNKEQEGGVWEFLKARSVLHLEGANSGSPKEISAKTVATPPKAGGF